ncbi:MAG: hypothetical protein LIP08_11120 [Bacteroides sp.]|nr:hypothetical protein [Bacteroides sp.]
MFLSGLNPIRYEQKKQVMVTVMKNGHIRLSKDAHYYSVPGEYIGKKVKLLYIASEVEVSYRYKKIAGHQRNLSRFRYTTHTDHLVSGYHSVREWSAEKFIAEASSIHPNVGIYITKVIESKAHPEQFCKSCSGILSFVRRVGASRLVNTYRGGNSYGLYNNPAVERISVNRQDELPFSLFGSKLMGFLKFLPD